MYKNWLPALFWRCTQTVSCFPKWLW